MQESISGGKIWNRKSMPVKENILLAEIIKHVHKTETETENRLFVKTETETETENRLLSKTETDNKH